MNLFTVLVLILLAMLAVLALRRCIRKKGCSGGCCGCPYADTCRKNEK